jgi:hypothetical protein
MAINPFSSYPACVNAVRHVLRAFKNLWCISLALHITLKCSGPCVRTGLLIYANKLHSLTVSSLTQPVKSRCSLSHYCC